MFPDSEPDYPKKTRFLFAVNCCVLAFAYPAIWLPVSSWNDFAASEKYLLFLSPIILVIFYFLENRLPSVIRFAEICFLFFPLLFFVRIFLEALSSSYVEILGFDFVFKQFLSCCTASLLSMVLLLCSKETKHHPKDACLLSLSLVSFSSVFFRSLANFLVLLFGFVYLFLLELSYFILQRKNDT